MVLCTAWSFVNRLRRKLNREKDKKEKSHHLVPKKFSNASRFFFSLPTKISESARKTGRFKNE
jgi:hypothetical protein